MIQAKLMDKIQEKYLARAKFAAKILQISPFLKMVGLNGSVARNKAKKSSDIDFLIITQKNRIWTARAFATILMAIFGLKRYSNKIAGKICLNLYQTEDNLELTCKTKKVALSNAYLVPLWQEGNIFKNFKNQNKWIKKFNLEFSNLDINSEKSKFFYAIKKTIERIFDSNWLEYQLKQYQRSRILGDPRTKKSKKGEIFISNKELRFHPPKGL